MPRGPHNVRNYWVQVHVDGRTTILEGGPKDARGGVEVRVHAREHGEVRRSVLAVVGTADPDGTLRLVVRDQDGAEVHCVTTER